jgi:hypothetical protein
MCHVIVKLTRHGLHSSIGGLQIRSLWVVPWGMSLCILRCLATGKGCILICIVLAGIGGRRINRMILPHGLVDFGKQRVKAMGHAGCFDVAGRL